MQELIKRKWWLPAFFIMAAAVVNLRAAEVMVFAAASLSDVLKEIAVKYEKDRVRFNFAASSMLARQIEEGAPADIFFSADEAKIDGLEKKGLIRSETRKSRLSNSLVIVVAAENGAKVSKPEDLSGLKRIALAETKTVPAGIYAKEYLRKQNLWGVLESKVIPTENVRAALSAVEAGNVEAAIVYKTDARMSKGAKIAYEVPLKEGPVISYPVAIVKGAKQPKAAGDFLNYLGGEEAGAIFEKHGFIIVK